MKAIALFLMTFFLAANGCEDMKDTVIEYNAHSRGMYLSIVVKDAAISISKQRKGEVKTVKLSDEEKKEIAKLLKEVEVKSLPDLKSPTEKRFYDGAAIATLKIIKNGETYESQAFDHGEPPAEIKPLVEKLLSFVTEE